MSDVALRFGATDDGLTAKFREVNRQLDDFERGANKTASLVSTGFKALAGVIGAVSLVRLTKEAFDYAESLEVASARTGIAIENLQRLQFISSQTDVSVDAVTASINRLQKELVTGGKEAADAITRIGLSVSDLLALSPDDQFLRVATAIAEIPDPAERSATAMQIFGKGGAELLPILTKGAEGVRELSAGFDRLGVELSAETVGKVDDAGDALGRLKLALKGVSVELLSLVAVPIAKTADSIVTFVKAVRYGLTGGDEAEQLNNRILELQGRVSLFAKDMSQTGQERLRQAKAELEILERRQQLELGVGEFGSLGQPRLQTFNAPQVEIPTANFGDTLGAREPTAAERRANADSGRTGVDIQIEENRVLEDLNQKHLDELLRQTTEYVAEKVHIESDAEQFLSDVRHTFGLEQIAFEEMKTMSLIDIGSMLFTSLAAQNSKLARIQKAIAIAQTIWATAAGVAEALKLPYPTNFIVGAKIALVGAAQLVKIKSTNYSAGGGGGGSAPSVAGGDSLPTRGSTIDAPVTPGGATARDVTAVYINGVVTHDVIQQLIVGLEDQFNRDVVVIRDGTAQAAVLQGA